jgi:hypothetical protein
MDQDEAWWRLGGNVREEGVDDKAWLQRAAETWMKVHTLLSNNPPHNNTSARPCYALMHPTCT